MAKPKRQVELLVEILLDKKEEIGARDDAAMYLGKFDDESAMNALIQIAKDNHEQEILLWSSGESLGYIWVRKKKFDRTIFDSLLPEAREELSSVIKTMDPEWAKTLQL